MRYGEAILQYVNRQVLPALRDLKDKALMVELLKRWQNHKIYVKWMDRFFTYLVPQRALAWEKQGLRLYVAKSSEVPLNSLYPHEIFFVRYSNNMSQLVADRARQLPTGTSPSSRIATTSSCSRRRI